MAVAGSIVSNGVASTLTGTITGPYMPQPPLPQIWNCFLCICKGQWLPAVTVYMGTYLCAPCAQSLPEKLIINELLP
jgi:hypothetical protein